MIKKKVLVPQVVGFLLGASKKNFFRVSKNSVREFTFSTRKLSNNFFSINATNLAFCTVYRHIARMFLSKFERSTIISFFVKKTNMNSYDFQEFGALIRNLRPFHFIFFHFFFDWNTLR